MDTTTQVTSALSTAEDQSTQAQALTVGVFDSGIGGFTVARSILHLRPDLNLTYYGDNINMPYGGRTPEQIRRFALRSIEFFTQKGIDVLAVGCNASNSVLGQGELRGFGIVVYDLVSSTVDWLRSTYGRPETMALVATQATVNSRYWERKLIDAFPGLELLSVAAPEFVPLVEAQQPDPQAIRAAVKLRLQPVLDSPVRTIIHGCTHYPLLENYMRELSAELTFIDPAECLAQRLAAGVPPAAPGAKDGKLRFYSSLPGETFYRTGQQAFGRPIRELTSMYIVNPHED